MGMAAWSAFTRYNCYKSPGKQKMYMCPDAILKADAKNMQNKTMIKKRIL